VPRAADPQWIAYRAKSLSLSHGTGLADSSVARAVWEGDPARQPARETLERLLLAYDWGEAFTALNLVVKPALDSLLKAAFADLAQANGDGLTAQLLAESGVDSARSQAWSSALARYAIAARPQNREVITGWEDRWRPTAERAVAGLAEVFATPPAPSSPAVAMAAVTAATDALRADWAG
jgi:toluene monooxygenase system protein E